jgi:3-hydroxyisobutyrate dehydrogenase-like beta-hydroxyacid dehydrogenase
MIDGAKTIAVLHPGELGASVAALARTRGARVVTTLIGRGQATAARCRESGVMVLDSLAEVARQADIVISLVPPAAAGDLVDAYCKVAHLAPRDALFVEANSIGPELARSLALKVTACGIGFVDAAINGLAKNIAAGGTLFLSGTRAAEIADWIGDAMRVRVLGPEPGRASAMKMLLGGLSKGICALYLELALVAQRSGMLLEMSEAVAMIYPGVFALADRMLPTYARHAARRVTEMSELESTARAAGIDPCVIDAVHRLHEALAQVPFDPVSAAAPSAGSLIERFAAEGFLSEPRA